MARVGWEEAGAKEGGGLGQRMGRGEDQAALWESRQVLQSFQAHRVPHFQWDMGLGHLICHIRRSGPKRGFSQMFSQAGNSSI